MQAFERKLTNTPVHIEAARACLDEGTCVNARMAGPNFKQVVAAAAGAAQKHAVVNVSTFFEGFHLHVRSAWMSHVFSVLAVARYDVTRFHCFRTRP